ncbi:TPA: hypothetical protein GDD06_08920 [Legionella pneumophila]|nr:hypothetical protein [Legionella pneumophila]
MDMHGIKLVHVIRKIKLFFLVVVITLTPSVLLAAEKAEICAKYQTASGWSDAYGVEATIIKGSELNQATSSFNYESFDTYVLIFWDRNEVSVIQMESPFVTFMEETGHDQQGREWQIKKGSVCF